jgi:hypothetical protein
MKHLSPFREPALVDFHLDHGYTRIRLTRLEHVGGVSQPYWDIPTDRIPLRLRAIGSKIFVIMPRFWPEEHDSIEEMPLPQCEVRELRDDDDEFTTLT